MATRPDDRGGSRVFGAPSAKPPKQKPPSKGARVFGANTAIFIPDALAGQQKPEPKSKVPYRKGRRPKLPPPDIDYLVKQAQQRQEIALGLKPKDQLPIARQDLRSVPSGEDVARARVDQFKRDHPDPIGDLVRKALSATSDAVAPALNVGPTLLREIGVPIPTGKQGAETVLKGTDYAAEGLGELANDVVQGLATVALTGGDPRRTQELSSRDVQRAGLVDPQKLMEVAAATGQFVENAVGGTAKGFLGVGPGMILMATDPEGFLKGMEQQYRDAYIDLLRGDMDAFLRKFYDNPSQYMFDLWGAASALGKIGSMAGIIKDPGRVAYHTVDGGKVQRYTSPNLLSRIIENKVAAIAERHPDMPIVGAKARIKANMRLQRERGMDREMAELADLQQATKWFRGVGPVARARNFALDVIAHYGDNAAESIMDEITFFKNELALANQIPNRRHRVLTKRRIRQQIDGLTSAIPLVVEPPPQLVSTVELVRAASNQATATRVAAGVLSPEAAANAPHARLRTVTPADDIANSPVREMLIQQIRASMPPELQDAAIRLHDAQVQAYARMQGRPASEVYNDRWGGVVEDPRFLMDNPPPVGGPLMQRHQETRSPEIQKYYENAARRLIRAHKGALPENAQTVRRLQMLLLKLRDRAIEAEMARFWYETSARAILRHTGNDVGEAKLLAKLIAIYSPRAEVWDPTNWNNTTRALGAYDEYKRTGKISDKWSLSRNPDGKRVYGDTKTNQKKGIVGQPIEDWQTANALRTMKGEGDWDGLKTNSFYSNFLKWIDNEEWLREFGHGHVTIDTWMRRAFGYLKGNKEQVAEQLAGKEPTRGFRKDGSPKELSESITNPMYAFMRDAVNDIAAELGDTIKMPVGSRDADEIRFALGWEPEAVQAAIWTSIKGEVEGTPVSTAGIDFGYALDSERTRHLARQRIEEIMNDEPEAPNPYAHVIGEPTALEMYDTFIRDQARETLGEASAAQIRRTEDAFKHLPDDDPRKRAYNALVDDLYAAGLTPDGSPRTPDPEELFQSVSPASKDILFQGDGPAEPFWYDRGFDEGYEPIDAGPMRVQLSPREMVDLQRTLEAHPQVPGLKDVMDSALDGESPTAVGNALKYRIEWAVTDPDTPVPPAELVDLVAMAEKLGAKPYMGPRGTDVEGFHAAAAQAIIDADALARDIGSMFPPDQWRAVAGGDTWVRNNLAKQGLLDENGDYIGRVPDTLPEDWLAQGGLHPLLERRRKAAVDSFQEVPLEQGFAAIQRAHAENSRNWNLSGYSLDDLRNANAKVFLAADGKAGFVLAPEGTGVSSGYFNNSGIKGLGSAAVERSILEGKKTLNAYDGYLPGFYERHGFREVVRMKFVEEFAPESMPASEIAKKPDVVFMVHNPSAPATRTERYVTDWDEAVAMTDEAARQTLEQRRRESPFDTNKTPEDPTSWVRGMVMFDENGKAYQWLNPEQAGLSTVRHEDIHAFRRQLSRDAEEGRPRAREILDELERMVGVKNGVWRRKHEEALAKLFEGELRSGQTATPFLRDAYRQARAEMVGQSPALWNALEASQRALLRELVDPNNGLFAEGAVYVKDTVGSPAMRALKSLPRGIRRPKKRNKRNLQLLFSSGRIRRGPRVVLEDAAEAKRMKVQLTTVEDILEQWGKPFEPELRQGLLDGYSIMNPDGIKIPRSFLHEALDDPEVHPRAIADAIMNDERQMLDNIFMDEERLGNLPPELRGKLYQVPTWVKDELMYGNLKLNGGGNDILNFIGGLFDSYNNVNRLTGIYMKPAYTVVNFTSNALLAALKQGVFFPVNLAQAAGVLGDLPKHVLRMLDEEVGSGASIAIGGEGKGALGTVTDAVARAQNILADRLMRRTAIIHELRKEGVIDLFGRDPNNAAKIVEFIRNPANKERLFILGMDAENSMVRFRGLSQLEKQVVSRGIYVYPWIKGATRYSIRLPWDMPVRASVISHMGQEGWEWVEDELGAIASFMRSKSPLTEIAKDGTVKVVDPNSLTAQSSAGDVLGALLKTTQGARNAPDFSRTLSSLFTPSLSLFTGQATGSNDLGRETGNVFEAFGSDVPNIGLGSFAAGMIRGGPKESKYYKSGGRKEVLGRFFLGALYPRDLKVEEAVAAGLKQMPTVNRWLALQKAGKEGYSAADNRQRLLRRQAKEIEKIDEAKASVFRITTALISASQNPLMADAVDGSMDGINSEIRGLNELRRQAGSPLLPELTPETYAEYKRAVDDAQEIVDSG